MSDHDAKRTVLSLLSAMGKPFPVAALLKAADILNVEQGAVRMALTRLKSQSLVDNPRRGVWVIGPSGQPMHNHMGAWRQVQSRAMGWDERSYVVVMCSTNSELTPTIVRRQERALLLLGFKAWRHYTWIRPHNLVVGVDGLREQLVELGLPGEKSHVAVMHHLCERSTKEVHALWHITELEDAYRDCIQAMTQAEQLMPDMPLEQAARHGYEVGDRVIRTLARDPVLPASMIDTRLRSQCIGMMHEFDAKSKELWGQVLQELV